MMSFSAFPENQLNLAMRHIRDIGCIVRAAHIRVQNVFSIEYYPTLSCTVTKSCTRSKRKLVSIDTESTNTCNQLIPFTYSFDITILFSSKKKYWKCSIKK